MEAAGCPMLAALYRTASEAHCKEAADLLKVIGTSVKQGR